MNKTISAGGIVINPRGLILLVNQNDDSWSFPKGHLDTGEDGLTAAKREIYEESGISELELIKKFDNYQRYKIALGGKGEDQTELKIISLFLFKTNQTKLNPSDPTIPKAQWVTKDKVADLLTHQKDKKFFLRIINQI